MNRRAARPVPDLSRSFSRRGPLAHCNSRFPIAIIVSAKRLTTHLDHVAMTTSARRGHSTAGPYLPLSWGRRWGRENVRRESIRSVGIAADPRPACFALRLLRSATRLGRALSRDLWVISMSVTSVATPNVPDLADAKGSGDSRRVLVQQGAFHERNRETFSDYLTVKWCWSAVTDGVMAVVLAAGRSDSIRTRKYKLPDLLAWRRAGQASVGHADHRLLHRTLGVSLLPQHRGLRRPCSRSSSSSGEPAGGTLGDRSIARHGAKGSTGLRFSLPSLWAPPPVTPLRPDCSRPSDSSTVLLSSAAAESPPRWAAYRLVAGLCCF